MENDRLKLATALATASKSAMGAQNFQLIKEVVKRFKSIENTKERWEAQQKVLKSMERYIERLGDMLKRVYKYVERDGAFRANHTKKKFLKQMSEIIVLVQANKNRRNRKLKYAKAAQSKWGKDVITTLGKLNTSGTFMSIVRKLANSMDFEEIATRINKALIKRLKRPRKNVSAQRYVQTIDFKMAKSKNFYNKVTIQKMLAFEVRLGELDILIRRKLEMKV